MKQNSPKPIRVLLADDHPIVRAGIREALKELPGVVQRLNIFDIPGLVRFAVRTGLVS
jgi:DNA-binding NarL/FixJ family response regulator